MIRAGFAGLLLALLLTRSAAAAPIDRAEYAAKLHGAASLLDQAAARGDAGKSAANAALSLLPERAQVTRAGQEPLTVDNREVLAALRLQIDGGRTGIETAAATLRSLESAVELEPRPLPDSAQAVLARVLSRSEFRPSRLARFQAWAMRLLARAMEWLQRLAERIANRFPSLRLGLSRSAQRAVLGILLAISALVTLYLIARVVLRGSRARQRAEQTRMPVPDPLKPHDQWLADAEAAYNSADYAAAIRALHMAALMKLDTSGHISYESSRTDGRFERALRARGLHEIASALRELNRLFATVWYGLGPAGPEQYQRARQHWSQLEAMISP